MSARPIFLVGMMGAGKSTVGPLLAARLGRPFVDTDEEVERATGRTIAELFAEEGEARFRELEREAIERAADRAAVVALGGGAIAQPGGADRLLELGSVVYLRVPPALLLERIGDPASRPLLAGLGPAERLERLTALLAERAAHYERASCQIDASGAESEVVDAILARLELD